jgi:Na+/H+ antiporter NhaC
MARSMPDARPPLRFHAGLAGALAPFLLFLAGVAWLGLSGAPDERGLWPVLLAALGLGLLLARDRGRFSEEVVAGMARPLVALMILAWLLAGVLGAVLRASGFVESLAQLAAALGVTGGAYVAAAFLACCGVATATGTSLGTILVAGPILYPAGGALGAEPAWLVGAILAGATFGDNVSPISDTTIASAGTQGAAIGAVVRSRMAYALPAGGAALAGFLLLGGSGAASSADAAAGALLPLGMALAPALALLLLLRGRSLLEGLLAGDAAACGVALALGCLAPEELLRIDAESFTARGLIVDGMESALGISVFTLLLVGLVGALEATGVVERLVAAARRRARSRAGAEAWVVGAASGAVLLTTHSVVAILAVGEFAREMGERYGLPRTRRANLLDVTVCIWPFLLPWFVPTILAASQTGAAAGLPRVGPLSAGLHNLYSWGLLAALAAALATGYGRGGEAAAEEARGPGPVL